MSVQRRGAGWRVRYSEGGTQRSRAFDKRADAVRFDAEVRRRRQLGTLADLAAPIVTLDQYTSETWAPTYAPLLAARTREVYAWAFDSHIGPKLGGLPLVKLTPPVISAWQAAMIRAGAGHETIVKARGVLSAILQTAVEGGLVPANAVRAVRAPKRREPAAEVKPLAPAAVEALRAQLGHRDAVLVSLLAYAGLRPGEARELAWGNVHDRTLTVYAAKTGKRRSVRLLDAVAADLRAWRMGCGRPGDDVPVIPNAAGGVMSAKSFNQWRATTFVPAIERAGLDRTHPYVLRHSFASLLIHEGRSVIEVARQLGHGASLTLSTYGHVIEELDGQHITADAAIAAARAPNLRRASPATR